MNYILSLILSSYVHMTTAFCVAYFFADHTNLLEPHQFRHAFSLEICSFSFPHRILYKLQFSRLFHIVVDADDTQYVHFSTSHGGSVGTSSCLACLQKT